MLQIELLYDTQGLTYICTDERSPCQLHWTVYWKCLHRRHISALSLWKSREPLLDLWNAPQSKCQKTKCLQCFSFSLYISYMNSICEFAVNAFFCHLDQMALKRPTVVWHYQIQNFDRATTVIQLKISNPRKAYWEFSMKNNLPVINFH